MKSRKVFWINLAIVTVSLLLIAAILLRVHTTKPPSAGQVYSDSLRSVVELCAQTQDVGESYGTAVFIDPSGLLVTNAHVVTYSQLGEQVAFDHYSIRFATEDTYRDAALVRFNTELDLALLQLSDTNCAFEPISAGKPDTVKSGDKVYAVGNSLNYGISISEGIVGVPRLEIAYENAVRTVIQCDLTIAEGNSGGALLNEEGELIGITTFRTKDAAGNVVHGFAYCVPIDIVMEYISTP